jgi:predicted nucleic acid-binding protein
MSAKYFLDTNVFVYAMRPGNPSKTQAAIRLIAEALDSGNGIVSYQVVQEFFSLAFRKFDQPLSVFEAEQYFDTVFRPLLSVHSSPALFVSALQLYRAHQFSWYDSLIIAAAQQAGCSILYSEGLQHGRRLADLKIENPFR